MMDTANYSTGSGVTVDANGLLSLNSKPSGKMTIWVVLKPNKGTNQQLLPLCGNNAASIPSVGILNQFTAK